MGDPALGVLIIGYGFAGSAIHDPLIRATGQLKVKGVVTGDPTRRALARRRHPDVALFDTASEALTSDDFDVVVVAVPNEYHADIALEAMDCGLTLVIDKPLASSAAEARYIVDAAESRGTSLAVFHNRRWDGDFMTVAKLVAGGRLGSVHRFSSRFDRWEPRASPGWRYAHPDQGGGVLLDLGSHLIDQALHLFGPVTAVYAELATRQPGRASEDGVFVALRHRSGVGSHLYSSAIEGEPSLRFHVSGSKGSYLKRGTDLQEESLLADLLPVPGLSGREPPERWGRLHQGESNEPVETVVGDWTTFYRELVGYLTHGGPIPVSGREAIETMRIIDAARLSASEREVVDVDEVPIETAPVRPRSLG